MSAYPYQFDIAAERGFRARRSSEASRSSFDESKLPAKVTAFRAGKEIVEPVVSVAKTVAPQTTRIGSVLRRKAEPVDAAVQARQAEVQRQAAIELEARKAELEAEQRLIEEAEAAQLRSEREDFIALVKETSTAAFFYAWSAGTTTQFLLDNAEVADIGWIRSTRGQLEDGIRRYEAKLASDRRDAEAARKAAEERERQAEAAHMERCELLEIVSTVDVEVFALVWAGKAYTRDQVVDWVRDLDIAGVRNIRPHFDRQIPVHAANKRRAAEEARRAAEEERERQAEADRKAEEARRRSEPVKAIAPKASVATPVNGGGRKSRSGGVSLEELRRRCAASAPVGRPPTKAEIEEISRQVNGEGQQKIVIVYVEDPKRSLPERIATLNPAVIARLHTTKPEAYIRVGNPARLELVAHTWPSIERLLAALKAAKTKILGKIVGDGPAIRRIEIFVAWCEQG